MSLPAEAPRDGLAADEGLISDIGQGGVAVAQARWWTATSPAVVVGLGLRQRVDEIVDSARCRIAGVDIINRRAGGGALLLDSTMVCGAVCVPLPHALVGDDVTESYRWLGQVLADVLGGRRIEVDEARADVTALRARNDPVAKWLLASCYGALSPHEVAIGTAKVAGIAQIRTRHKALFQFGVLLRDQAPLADLLNIASDSTRDALRVELGARTAGVELTNRSISAMAAAIADAMPCEQ